MNYDGTLTVPELRRFVRAAVAQVGLNVAEPESEVVDAIVDEIRNINPRFDPSLVRYSERSVFWGYTRVETRVSTNGIATRWPRGVPDSVLRDTTTQWGLLGERLPRRILQPYLWSAPPLVVSVEDAAVSHLDPAHSIREYLMRKMRNLRAHNERPSIHDLIRRREVPTFEGPVSELLAGAAHTASGVSYSGYVTPSALLRDEHGTVWLDTYVTAGQHDHRRRVSVFRSRRGRRDLMVGVRAHLVPEPAPIPHHDGLVIVDRLYTVRDDRTLVEEHR